MDNQVSDLKPREMVEIFRVREHGRKSRPTGMELGDGEREVELFSGHVE